VVVFPMTADYRQPGSFKKGGILLANSEASKFRLAFNFFEGPEAWKKLGGNLGFLVVAN
jgi:hypothetical protein